MVAVFPFYRVVICSSWNFNKISVNGFGQLFIQLGAECDFISGLCRNHRFFHNVFLAAAQGCKSNCA